jgi:hypothetical protein
MLEGHFAGAVNYDGRPRVGVTMPPCASSRATAVAPRACRRRTAALLAVTVPAVLLPKAPLRAQDAQAPPFDLAPTCAALRAEAPDWDSERTVAGSAWRLFAFLAEGSNLRGGPSRDAVKLDVVWLRQAQNEAGAFAPDGVTAPRDEQLLATLALVDVFALSNYQLLKPTVVKACRATAAAFSAPDPAVDAETAALLAVLATSVEWALGDGEPTVAQLRERAAAAIAPLRFGGSRRGDAALQLARQLLGEPDAPDLVFARAWPGDLTRDPLHTWLAVRTLLPYPERLRAESFAFERLLAARATDGDDAGTWQPTAGFDRTTTSAMFALAIGMANGAWRQRR